MQSMERKWDVRCHVRMEHKSLIAFVFFLMIRRPPRTTQSRSSAASDVYKRQVVGRRIGSASGTRGVSCSPPRTEPTPADRRGAGPVSYTHLRAHETVLDLVCRLLLEKKKKTKTNYSQSTS